MESERDFAQLYDGMRKPLWTYVYRASGSADEADDIVQEAFLRFWRSDTREIDHAQARPYLFTIASNLLTDRWRTSARRQSWLTRWFREQPDVHVPIASVTGEQHSHGHLARTFHRLKPRDRALLWMAYVEEADHAHIAEALGLRSGSIKVMLFRARKRLRALIGDASEEANDERTEC